MDNNYFNKNYFVRFKHDKSNSAWDIFYGEQIIILKKLFNSPIRVCDIGCGLGSFLEKCDAAGYITFGMDVSEYAIENARKKTTAKLIVGDIQNGIPFEDCFDVITGFDTIEHLKNPDTALINMYNKLKKGGIILITTPNLRSKFWKRISKWQEDETHISLMKPEKWRDKLEEAGFIVIDFKTIFPLLLSSNSKLKQFMGRILSIFGFGSTLLILAKKETS